jgi:uncharacterized protein (DUF4415 family)
MPKRERIVSYTADELKAMKEKGLSKSDWNFVDSMTEEDLEAAIASDPDEAGMEVDWTNPLPEPPRPKAVLNMRVDADVFDFFKSQGKGYQTKINAVLRSYVERVKSRA